MRGLVRFGVWPLAAVLAAAGCSGGSSRAVPAAPAARATAPATQAITFALRIPAHATLARRRSQFVSPSTQSVKFTDTTTGTVTKANLKGCTVASNGDKLCNIPVTAQVGANLFTVVAYDQQFDGSGNLPGGTNALSGASAFSVNVTEGQSNVSVPLITGGVPATVGLSLGTGVTSYQFNAAASLPLTVTVYDADGNIIVAPGAFVDTTGAGSPLTITSTNGNSGFGYAVTSATTGMTGATGATIALTEPDDTVALKWNGTSYVPPSDTLTFPNGVTKYQGGGATSVAFEFGYRFTPPFTPTFLASGNAALATAIGHEGIVIAGPPNKLAFVGDTTGTCTIASIEGGSVTGIGGLSLDPTSSTADTYAYASLTDNGNTILEQFYLSSIIAGGSCARNAAYGPFVGYAPGAVSADNNHLFASLYGGGALVVFADNYLSSQYLTLFTPRALAARPGGTAVLQVAEKKALAEFDTTANETATAALATITDPYPFGAVVDRVNNVVYANDTTTATFGSAGGIESFATLPTVTGSAQLAAGIVANTSTYQNQNMALGSYSGSRALYVLCNDGIEVFPISTTGFSGTRIAPVETLALPSGTSGTAIVGTDDGAGRPYVLLSDGTIDVLAVQ